MQPQQKNILRVEERESRKIKDWQGLARFIRHCLREQETLNADMDKTDLNFCLQGNASDVQGTIQEYIDSLGINIDNGKGTKNQSRIVTELLISASPSYFYECEQNEDGSIKHETRLNAFSGKEELQAVFKLDEEGNKILKEKETTEWLYTNHKWLKEQFGSDYVFGMAHMDESTPHISVLVCGTNYHKKWKKHQLSHSKHFGTDYKLRDLHTSHANYLKEHGIELERGEEKLTKAERQTIKDAYNNANKLVNSVEETKAKAIELLEEKDSEIEDIKHDLDTTKVKAGKELLARDRVLGAVADKAGIERDKVNKVLDKAREDLGLEADNSVSEYDEKER